MNFGAHISIAGGIDKSPERAREIGCECFQMFSKSPHGGKSPIITKNIADIFKEQCKKYNLKNYYIHTPYYINLASANNRIYYGSISAIKEELNKADLLGAKAVVTHLGSAKDLGVKEGEKKLIEGLKKIFLEKEEVAFKARLFLEITAGAGEIMGDTFEEMAHFIEEVEKDIHKNKLGVCFDTAHAFASGYDLRTEKTVKETFDNFDKIIGLERLGLIHCNDSLVEFNSHKDRHDNIGNGKIGLEGFKAILKDKRLSNLDFIVETPNGKEEEDLEILKVMR
jgi:deoxyribonuclease IV